MSKEILHKICNRVLRTPRKYFGSNFPDLKKGNDNVSIVIVNYNTKLLISSLIYSIYKQCYGSFNRIIVVDNNSNDGSKELLYDMHDAGLIDIILNEKQRYHGPGLNDGIDFLTKCQKHPNEEKDITDYIWVLDSDVVILRNDTIKNSIKGLKEANACLCGQFSDNISWGYADISSLLFDPILIWKRGFSPFEEHGLPAKALQESVIKHSLKRLDFPYQKDNYIIHLHRGTLKGISANDLKNNRYYSWAKGLDNSYNTLPEVYTKFMTKFNEEVPELTSEYLIKACLKRGTNESLS